MNDEQKVTACSPDSEGESPLLAPWYKNDVKTMLRVLTALRSGTLCDQDHEVGEGVKCIYAPTIAPAQGDER